MSELDGRRGPGSLTDIEWAAVDAIRSGLDIATSASVVDLDEPTFRQAVAAAGEKLRMSSTVAEPSSREASAGAFQVPHLDSCPYCEIFAGRFSARSRPPAVIHEHDDVFVFLAPAPMGGMPGHTLVTTRRHVETVFDLTSDEAALLGAVVARTARMLRSALSPEGLLIQQNNGAAAFQTVPHIHFHVIPKVAGPFPPVEPPAIVPANERAAFAAELRGHW